MTNQQTGVVWLIGLAVCTSCSQAPHTQEVDYGPDPYPASHPKSVETTPGDFVDRAGRAWRWKGPAKFHAPGGAVFDSGTTYDEAKDTERAPTRDELAAGLRPYRLIGDQEYQLAEPDYALADAILAMREPPSTPPREASVAPSSTSATQTRPLHIIGDEDRWRQTDTTQVWYRQHGFLQSVCSAVLINGHTALTAAHCFYEAGAWINTSGINFGADTDASLNEIFPNGPAYKWQNMPVQGFINIPTAWRTGGGSEPLTTSNRYWDFAFVDFSSNGLHPGWTLGWYGTTGYYSPFDYYMVGYPHDRPKPQQWVSPTWNYTAETNDGKFKHWADMANGTSGACIFDSGHYCFGVNVAESGTGVSPKYNVGRKWDSTTYNYVHQYGNFP
jgi:V8-like Glu-specific endopeptidase